MNVVLNKKHDRIPPGAVYIGRPSEWGNPFVLGRDGTRAEVIGKYRRYLMGKPLLMERARNELHGKDLVCWCAPLPCHGDVLMEVAQELSDREMLDIEQPD